MSEISYKYGRKIDNPLGNAGMSYAEHFVFREYGDEVSIEQKAKSLKKFGRNATVGTSFESVAIMQGAESVETFVTTNIIDSIVSSSASDTTQTITVEGHIVDTDGNMTFAVQNAVLNGRTEVTLTTPLARCTRAYVKNSGTFGTTPAALIGAVSVYDNTGGITNGVPNTASATKIIISAGETQSEKASTTIAALDYWFITSFTAGVGNTGGNADRVTIYMETRDIKNGGAWRPMGGDIVIIPLSNGRTQDFDPPLIVPKNHDWRVMAKTNTGTAEVFAEAQGILAGIVSL